MPVGTHAVMRGHHIETIRDLEFQIILANTYHLLLRPGAEVFRAMGGIHRFMNWPRSLLTDSGGFQIFSLAHSLAIAEEGATFRSYVDGKKILLSPEASIEMQCAIGSDIMMVLDQCIPATADRIQAREALERTTRWARRSRDARGESDQALFGIVQGACYPDLRAESARQITDLDFEGYAIGGLAVGEERSQREDMVACTAALLPGGKPRYLMGVGTPIDLLEAVARGVDMFDCILPTALAQQGVCFTSHGRIDLRRGVYRLADVPLDADCPCSTCRTYSRAYLHHLTKIGEMIGGTLVGIHNLSFYSRLMNDIRCAIVADTFEAFYQRNREPLSQRDVEYPTVSPSRKPRPSNETLGDYEVHVRSGSAAIRQRSSGEVMHPVGDPAEEARLLYVEQSGLCERLAGNPEHPHVLWDVGLGSAMNAMAVIHAYENAAREGARLAPLEIVSFENDLDSLRLTVLNPGLFAHVRHPAPHILAKRGEWQSDTHAIRWKVHFGDFLLTMHAASAPHIIYYDPFSYKTDAMLWTRAAFAQLFRCCIPGQTALYTYSASTAVRTALLLGGFSVGAGIATGPKKETTVAYCTPLPGAQTLLGPEWLSRWERSDTRVPLHEPAELHDVLIQQIYAHPQFQGVKVQI